MMFYYISINFTLGLLRMRKELNFYRSQKLKKIVRPRVKFFEPVLQLELPELELPPIRISLTGTCPNFCAIENLSFPVHLLIRIGNFGRIILTNLFIIS